MGRSNASFSLWSTILIKLDLRLTYAKLKTDCYNQNSIDFLWTSRVTYKEPKTIGGLF